MKARRLQDALPPDYQGVHLSQLTTKPFIIRKIGLEVGLLGGQRRHEFFVVGGVARPENVK